MSELTQDYMSKFVDQFNSNRKQHWEVMIVGLNLLIASTVERYCYRFGASQISLN